MEVTMTKDLNTNNECTAISVTTSKSGRNCKVSFRVNEKSLQELKEQYPEQPVSRTYAHIIKDLVLNFDLLPEVEGFFKLLPNLEAGAHKVEVILDVATHIKLIEISEKCGMKPSKMCLIALLRHKILTSKSGRPILKLLPDLEGKLLPGSTLLPKVEGTVLQSSTLLPKVEGEAVLPGKQAVGVTRREFIEIAEKCLRNINHYSKFSFDDSAYYIIPDAPEPLRLVAHRNGAGYYVPAEYVNMEEVLKEFKHDKNIYPKTLVLQPHLYTDLVKNEKGELLPEFIDCLTVTYTQPKYFQNNGNTRYNSKTILEFFKTITSNS